MADAKKRLTKEEIIKSLQQACLANACATVRNNSIHCPFCPHHKKEIK